MRSHWVQLHKRGVGVVLTPFGQCHCTTGIRGVIPLENPVFTPPSAASLRRNGGLGRGGSFSFSPLVFFSLYSILLGVVHSHCVQLHKRGVGTLCAVFRGRIGPSTKPRTMPARATSGCRRDGRKHGSNCTETGSFSHRPPRSSSRGEHAVCRRTVPSPCAGGGGKTRPRKRQMQGKNVICNDLCAKSACISKKKPTFAVELSYYYCQPHHAKKITSFLHGAAHLGGGAHGGRPPQAQ